VITNFKHKILHTFLLHCLYTLTYSFLLLLLHIFLAIHYLAGLHHAPFFSLLFYLFPVVDLVFAILLTIVHFTSLAFLPSILVAVVPILRLIFSKLALILPFFTLISFSRRFFTTLLLYFLTSLLLYFFASLLIGLFTTLLLCSTLQLNTLTKNFNFTLLVLLKLQSSIFNLQSSNSRLQQYLQPPKYSLFGLLIHSQTSNLN